MCIYLYEICKKKKKQVSKFCGVYILLIITFLGQIVCALDVRIFLLLFYL